MLFDFFLFFSKVYVSEISSPDIRGFLSAIQKVSGHLGFLLSYLLGAYLGKIEQEENGDFIYRFKTDDDIDSPCPDWRQLALLIAVAPLLLFMTVIFIPETPSFLVLNGRDDDAYR